MTLDALRKEIADLEAARDRRVLEASADGALDAACKRLQAAERAEAERQAAERRRSESEAEKARTEAAQAQRREALQLADQVVELGVAFDKRVAEMISTGLELHGVANRLAALAGIDRTLHNGVVTDGVKRALNTALSPTFMIEQRIHPDRMTSAADIAAGWSQRARAALEGTA